MLTIVTVVKEDRPGLEKTLVSAQNQSEKNWQLIVVYPKSDVQIAEYVKRVHLQDERINGVPEDSPGIYQAMNTGLRFMKSEFFWFMNAGDLFTNENSIQLALRAIDELSADLIVGCYSVLGGFEYEIERTEKITPRKFSLNVRKGCHQAMIFRANGTGVLSSFDTKYPMAADFLKVLQFAENNKSYWVPLNLALISPNGVSHTRIQQVIKEKQSIRAEFFGTNTFDFFLGWIWGVLLKIKIRVREISGI